MTNFLSDYIQSGQGFFPSDIGQGYRCSATLSDGTHLPCVILRKPKEMVDLLLVRLEEERGGRGIFKQVSNDPYRKFVGTLFTGRNLIRDFDIKSVSPSPFAMPLDLLKQIKAESIMGWTGFVFEMTDGKLFSYGTTFNFEFFDLPEGYDFTDVKLIHNHSYLNENGDISPLRGHAAGFLDTRSKLIIYREKVFFECFVGDHD